MKGTSMSDKKQEEQPTVLLVEDDIVVATTYQLFLAKEPINLISINTGAGVLMHLQESIPDVILLDLGLPDMNGMEILKHIQQERINSAVIVITAQNSIDVVVESMRCGALDFLEKPFQANRLIITLRNALRQQNLNQLVDFYKKSNQRYKYHKITGGSKPMQAVYNTIESVAQSKAPVFITGESGTGKELCAEAIHEESQRKDEAFIAINCAAIPKDLMESEIFGHVKGAFTGADKARAGAATLANGGTLFLDEIGDMDMGLQRKLLRFIQTETFQKVGTSHSEQVDIRFICATHRDPLAEIQAGRFREDLYYRLNVISIKLPALRERENDVLLIARQFLTSYAKEENKSFVNFSQETETILKAYQWPGNVRQLLNVIRHIVVLNEGEVVTPNMLPSPLTDLQTRNLSPKVSKEDFFKPNLLDERKPRDLSVSKRLINSPLEIRPLWESEKALIEEAIEICGGDIPKAALFLEINASTIYRKRRKWKKEAENQ
jgi:two-component system, repressor protein LuxO